MQKVIFSLDVESIGLYGAPFAFGASVRDTETDKEIDSFFASCSPYAADPDFDKSSSKEWLEKNVIPTLPAPTHPTARAFRDAVWAYYRSWADRPGFNVTFVADCGAPVEANLFRYCVLDDPAERNYKAPYPLHELGTLLLAAKQDPIGDYGRLEDESPAHNPVNDARQSGRIWVWASKLARCCLLPNKTGSATMDA